MCTSSSGILYEKLYEKGNVFMAERVIDFKCTNCGGAMKSTGHVNGKVECPFCHTECIIDGLIKNAEILEKENINSGVSIDLEKDALNKSVVEALTGAIAYPLDILENGAVIKEEHLCIPSYLFYSNGVASFTYEAGNERTQQKVEKIKSSGKVKTTEEKYIEWSQMSGSTSVSANVVAPGNREYSEVIKNLFIQYDVNKLVDIEWLALPTDVETCGFNFPQPAAFGEVVKPYVESLLKDAAEKTLYGKTYRNLTMGGCNVQKDEVLRLSLGLYKFAFQYKDKVHTLYIAGDGSNYYWDIQPVDAERLQKYNELRAQEEKLGKNSFMIWTVVCLIAALFTSGITLIGTALFGFLWFKRKKGLKEVKAQIDAFIAESEGVKQNFMQSGTFIRGIN